jgi:hypothetical protein
VTRFRSSRHKTFHKNTSLNDRLGSITTTSKIQYTPLAHAKELQNVEDLFTCFNPVGRCRLVETFHAVDNPLVFINTFL